MPGSAPDNWRDEIRELLTQVGPTGNSPDDLKAAVKRFRATQWQLTAKTALALLDNVLADGQRDEIVFGILLLTLFKRQLPETTWPAVTGWTERLDSTVIGDLLAVNIIGRLVAEEPKRLRVVQGWLASENEYRRRCAVMTACTVLTKEGCTPKALLKLVEPLMLDPSAHVHQAVAKAIRQVSRSDEDLAVALLKKWKGRCHPEIFREGSQNLSAGARIALGKAKSHRA